MLTWAIAAVLSLGQAPEPPAGLIREYNASDAAVDAVFDLAQNVAADQRAYTFYLWDNCGNDNKSRGALNYAVNAVLSARPQILYLVPCGKEKRLLRGNLYDFARDRRDFEARLFKEYNALADFDPVFHEPADKPQVETIYETVAPYVASDGKTYDWIAKKIVRHEKVQPQIASGGAGPLKLLEDLTGMRLPIAAGDWFVATSLTQIEIDGIFGRYYRLRGLPSGNRGRVTDLDVFLALFGTDAKAVAALRSDQQTLMKSGVIKNFRVIKVLPSFGTTAAYGPGVVTLSQDLTNLNLDPAKDQLENLIDGKFDASEIIATLPNGLHAYFLADGNGTAVNEVPATVAAWPGSPHGDGGGGTKQLFPAISCIDCHGKSKGWIPTRNYVRELKERGVHAKFDFAFGKRGHKTSFKEFVDRLSDLYDGDVDYSLKVSGAGYANAADLAGLRAWSKEPIEGVSAELVRIYSEYFAEISTVRALRELGYRWVGDDEGALLSTFSSLVPPAEGDPGRLALLRINQPIRRYQWNQIRYEVALRDVVHAGLPPLALPTGFRNQAMGSVRTGVKTFSETRTPAPAAAPAGPDRPAGPRTPAPAVSAAPAEISPAAASPVPRPQVDPLPREHRISAPAPIYQPEVAVLPREHRSSSKSRIRVQYTQGASLWIWAWPGTRLAVCGRDVGRMGASGYREFYYGDRVPAAGWQDYKVQVGDETVTVDVRQGRQIDIIAR